MMKNMWITASLSLSLSVALFSFFILSPCSQLNATPTGNTPQHLLYLSIDGLNRSTLYGLMTKNQIPHLSSIAQKGGIRNLSVPTTSITVTNSISTLLTGYPSSDHHQNPNQDTRILPYSKSLFKRLPHTQPNTNTGFIFSTSTYTRSLNNYLHDVSENMTISFPIKQRSTAETGADIRHFLEQSISDEGNPFLLFANFSQVEEMGRRYRAGGEYYSTALKRIDRETGKIKAFLEENDYWDNTLIIISTNYGFTPVSRLPYHPNIWIISSEKIRYTGTQASIIPTIYSHFNIEEDKKVPQLPGKKLIY